MAWLTDGTASGTRQLTTPDYVSRQFGDGDQFLLVPRANDGPRVLRLSDGDTVVDLLELTQPTRSGNQFTPVFYVEDVFTTESDTDAMWVIEDKSTEPVHFEETFGVKFQEKLLFLRNDVALLFRGVTEPGQEAYWVTDGTSKGSYKVAQYPTSAFDWDRNRVVEGKFVGDRRFFQVGNNIVFDATLDIDSAFSRGKDVFSFPLNPPGDIDANGAVNFADFLILSDNFGLSDTSPDQGDLDKDGEVSLADFVILQEKLRSADPSLIDLCPVGVIPMSACALPYHPR